MIESEQEQRTTFELAQWAVEIAKERIEDGGHHRARSRLEDIEFHFKYSEPGYGNGEFDLIAVANWNSITKFNSDTQKIDTLDRTMPRMAKIFEALGMELEWCDEWTTCGDCMGLVRTSPDSYGWSASYVIMDGDLVCMDCLDPQEYLESIEGDSTTLNRIFDPSKHGYVHIMDFEHGFHRGQDASPELIGNIMEKSKVSRWLFNLESKGQFDMCFAVYIHEEEGDEAMAYAKRDLEQGQTDGPSVSEAAKAGLQAASAQASKLRSEGHTGIIMTHVGDGETTVKEVSVEDFIDGKALD